ncbi:MAG: hypothetical protein ACRCYO_11825 [Bacteroidia bacterium]
MTPLFKKLNFKNQKSIVVINHPESFEEELKQMSTVAEIIRDVKKAKAIEFVICFATKQKELDEQLKQYKNKLEGDALVWICYPKGSSKKYTCDFNRDTGWGNVGNAGLEPVRVVALDEDWSALRFRKVEFIKTITRRESFALTKDAKKRTTQKGK